MGRRVLRKGDMSLTETLNFHFFIILFLFAQYHASLNGSCLSHVREGKNSEKLNDSAVGVPSNFRILQLFLPPIPVPLKLSFPSSPECLNGPQFKKTKLDKYQRGTLSKLANEPFLLFAQITFLPLLQSSELLLLLSNGRPSQRTPGEGGGLCGV